MRGLAETYTDLFLPLFGDHQAQNAAVAIAAVESFLGGGTQPLVGDVLAEGLGAASSPGRLQIVGTEPTVLVDAAHNPHGAAALAAALGTYFTFDEIAIVLGVLEDKDERGIIEALAPVATILIATQSESERAISADELGETVREIVGRDVATTEPSVAEALEAARAWAAQGERRAVVVTGSITLVGEAIALAAAEGWKR